jgi:hypothetical protein
VPEGHPETHINRHSFHLATQSREAHDTPAKGGTFALLDQWGKDQVPLRGLVHFLVFENHSSSIAELKNYVAAPF